MDRDAGLVDSTRESAHIVQGMNTEAGVIADAAMEARRPQAALLQLIDAQQLELLAEDAGHEVALFLELGPAARQMRQRYLAPLMEPRIDAMHDQQ